MNMQKSDNIKFTLFENGLLRLYTNMVPLEIEGDEPRTEYVCDMYELYTQLTEAEIEQQFDALVAEAKAIEHKAVLKAKSEQAQAYLNSTDWVVAQLGEYQMLGKDLPDRSEILNKREEARNIIREAQND